MKKLFKIILIVLIVNKSYGQDYFSIEPGDLSIDFLKVHAKDIGVIDLEKSRKYKAILNLDVFDYFKLQDLYDTDLKKKVFKESPEYKEYLEKLKTEKELLQNKFFYIYINPLFKGHSYHKGEYNLEAKGFFIKTCWSYDYDFKHKIDKNYIYFKSLPTKIKSENFLGNTSKWEEFLFQFQKRKH